jgi:hypothetical protein
MKFVVFCSARLFWATLEDPSRTQKMSTIPVRSHEGAEDGTVVVGTPVGGVGERVGLLSVGPAEGAAEGAEDGAVVVGLAVGAWERVGDTVGANVTGAAEGPTEGANVSGESVGAVEISKHKNRF